MIEKLKIKLFNFIDILFHITPIDNKRIFFSSFHGQYNDNPKYISMELYKMRPDIKQVWVISNKSQKNDLPPYIKTVHYNTFEYCFQKNRSKIIVENGAGDYIFNTRNRFSIKKCLKNKKQFDLSTWHGNPIKQIGAQIPGINWSYETFHSTSDLMTCGCEYVKQIFQRAFLNKLNIQMLGTPRTDILFDKSEDKLHAIKNKLQLPFNKKVILYAPTYRNNVFDSGIKQLEMMNLDLLFDSLHKRFGGEWVLVYRFHNMVLLSIDKNWLKKQRNILNGNQFDDMMEYMFAADALITDYSGCIFDIMHTNKPCFLFAHDKENYIKNERGSYIPLSDLPYDFADSFESLISNINNYNEESTQKKVETFQNKIGNMEDGHASERICNLIVGSL